MKKKISLLFGLLGALTVMATGGYAAAAAKSKAPEVTIVDNIPRVIAPNQRLRVTYQLSFLHSWKGKDLPEITANLRPVGASLGSRRAQLIRPFVSGNKAGKKFLATFALPKLATGDYALDFGYRKDGKFLMTKSSAYLFTKLAKRKPQNLTDSGNILWHGVPFFPIGMYHPQNDYKLLSQNGFNAVQGNATQDLDQFKKSLDQANKYGLAVDVPLYAGGQVRKKLANSLEKLRRFGDNPAVLCWKILDEPHITGNRSVALGVPAAYRALKKADPNHPLELTLNRDATLGFWSNFSDIVQIDRYPVRGKASSDLTQVASFARNAKNIMQPWQNLTFVAQSGWKLDLSTQPSVAQARSMVYLALINGAKGIFWYSMHEKSGWNLAKTPLWPHMKDINAEISALSKPMMLGKVVPVQSSEPHVYVTARSYRGKLYVLVTNALNSAAKVNLNVPHIDKLNTGSVLKTAFSSPSKIIVKHPTGAPNSIALKLGKLESETLVFEQLTINNDQLAISSEQ